MRTTTLLGTSKFIPTLLASCLLGSAAHADLTITLTPGTLAAGNPGGTTVTFGGSLVTGFFGPVFGIRSGVPIDTLSLVDGVPSPDTFSYDFDTTGDPGGSPFTAEWTNGIGPSVGGPLNFTSGVFSGTLMTPGGQVDPIQIVANGSLANVSVVAPLGSVVSSSTVVHYSALQVPTSGRHGGSWTWLPDVQGTDSLDYHFDRAGGDERSSAGWSASGFRLPAPSAPSLGRPLCHSVFMFLQAHRSDGPFFFGASPDGCGGIGQFFGEGPVNACNGIQARVNGTGLAELLDACRDRLW